MPRTLTLEDVTRVAGLAQTKAQEAAARLWPKQVPMVAPIENFYHDALLWICINEAWKERALEVLEEDNERSGS